MSTAIGEPPGYYGKLPARGDFVGRRLGRPFIDAWDAWLQRGILASREALGPAWLEIYLTSPLWRFACAAGTCGSNAVTGIMMPSVDTVGRYYPLMLGCELPGDPDIEAVAVSTPWYEALEALALSALENRFDLATLDRPLAVAIAPARQASDGSAASPAAPGVQIGLPDGLGDTALRRALAAGGAARTLWWTQGSDRVGPSLLCCPSLPEPEAFAALLDGQWAARGWRVAELAGSEPVVAVAEAPDDSMPAWDREE